VAQGNFSDLAVLPGVLYTIFPLSLTHNTDFDKIAVVEDNKWQSWLIKVSDIFFLQTCAIFQ